MSGRSVGRNLARLSRADWAVVLFLLTPAVIIPEALNRFVFGKLFVASIAAILAFLVPACGRMTTIVRALLGVSVALLMISALSSAAPTSAVLGRAPLSEGALVLAVYLLAGLSGGRLLGPSRSPRAVHVALATMAICTVAVALLAILESFGLRPLSSNLDRPGSLLGNASDEGAFAVLYGGPLIVSAIQSRRAMPIVGASAALITVVLSASRGALVGLVAMLLIVAVVSSRQTRRVAVATIAGATALAMAVPFTRDRIFELSPLARQTVTGRTQLWHETLALLGHHPILGVGPSQFENAIVAEHTLSWQEVVGPANPPGSPHNWILQTAVAAGPLLVAVVVALIWLLVRNAVRLIRDGETLWAPGVLAGLTGYGVALLFHFTAPSTTIPAALLAGSLLAVGPEPVTRAVQWTRRGVVVLAGVLAVCFMFASIAEIFLRVADVDIGKGRMADANGAFNDAWLLRRWDVDLPAQALHQFVAAAAAGNSAATSYATTWSGRVGPVANDEQVLENRAALLETKRDYAGAAMLLDGELRIDSNNPILLLQRGVIYAQQGDNTHAEGALKRVAAITPSDPEPWHDLAIIYKAEGKASAAATAQATAQRLQSASR